MRHLVFLFSLTCALLGLLFILVFGTYIGTAHAAPAAPSAEQERIYLVQLVNQLDAMLPLVVAAQKAQPHNQRVNFHYTAWRDAKGRHHNGLLEDLQTIKAGIEEKLNKLEIEPRAAQPLSGDYLDSSQVK